MNGDDMNMIYVITCDHVSHVISDQFTRHVSLHISQPFQPVKLPANIAAMFSATTIEKVVDREGQFCHDFEAKHS